MPSAKLAAILSKGRWVECKDIDAGTDSNDYKVTKSNINSYKITK